MEKTSFLENMENLSDEDLSIVTGGTKKSGRGKQYSCKDCVKCSVKYGKATCSWTGEEIRTTDLACAKFWDKSEV